MLKYLVKRILTLIVVLLGISIIVFTLVHIQPGNPYSTMIDPNISQEVYENMLKEIGYYDSLPIQYIKWIKRTLHGDLGYSIHYKAPVIDVINSRIWNTFILASVSMILSICIAIPAGIISATKKYSIFDYIVTIISFIGISIPSFFFGLLMIKWFSFDLKIFPVSGMTTVGTHYTGIKGIVDVVKHMVLPVIVLSFLNLAMIMRYTRSSILEVINQDYIRTARAKGLSEGVVICVHGFRNALISIITILCIQIPSLFSGALLTETIFVWPGIGRLNYEAVLNRDYPLIMGILMILSIIILLSNLLADILYVVADPRIRYD